MDTKGFFASLFDTSFSSLITTKVIKVVYFISLVAIGIVAVIFVVGAFNSSTALGVVTLLVLAPIGALFYVVYTRVILEFIIVVFRIAEYNRELVELQRAQVSPAVAASAVETTSMPPVPPAPGSVSPPPPPEPPAEPQP